MEFRIITPIRALSIPRFVNHLFHDMTNSRMAFLGNFHSLEHAAQIFEPGGKIDVFDVLEVFNQTQSTPSWEHNTHSCYMMTSFGVVVYSSSSSTEIPVDAM